MLVLVIIKNPASLKATVSYVRMQVVGLNQTLNFFCVQTAVCVFFYRTKFWCLVCWLSKIAKPFLWQNGNKLTTCIYISGFISFCQGWLPFFYFFHFRLWQFLFWLIKSLNEWQSFQTFFVSCTHSPTITSCRHFITITVYWHPLLLGSIFYNHSECISISLSFYWKNILIWPLHISDQVFCKPALGSFSVTQS